ncbi:MAG: DUF4158 domain-containing protein, partial [Actinomycetota bacterium]|nr:DUF4158 domain-containing protein [Actinomycetota bacterium]
MDGGAEDRGGVAGRQVVLARSPAFRRRKWSSAVLTGDGWDEQRLRELWTLVPEDLELISKARGDHNRLALALLLTCARGERRLISDVATLPAVVVGFVAAQVGVDPRALADYR